MKKKLVALALGLLLLLSSVPVILLLINPMSVYKSIHFGWIIALYIVIPLALTALFYFMVLNWEMILPAVFCCVSLALIPLMIVGVSRSRNTVYELYTANDMQVIGNAPTDHRTMFVLQNDIDFTGEDVSGWFGRIKVFKGIFEGNGYTLSHITLHSNGRKMEKEDRGPSSAAKGLGLVRTNKGIIRNLNFEDCKFTMVGDFSRNYDTFSFYFGTIAACNSGGKIADCNVINCYAKYRDNRRGKVAADLAVGYNILESYRDGAKPIAPLENVNVIITEPIAESFYKEDNYDWYRIEKKEDKKKN